MLKVKEIQCRLVIASFALSMTVITPAWPQGGADPIGELKKASTFDRAQHVDVAKPAKGKPVCYFREEGSSHTLEIGIGAAGAFIRVASGDGPLDAGSIPKPPLKVFAGKELTKLVGGDLKSTGEYESFQTYAGAFDYVPNVKTVFGGGFVVIAKGDAKAFLDMVARARREFVVVQSGAEPKNVDVIAIYDFNTSAVSALLACAKKHVQE
jgi:hypothetical protein